MADNFTTPVADGTAFASADIGGVNFPKNQIVDAVGNEAIAQLLTALAALATDTHAQAIATALAGTLAVSAVGLPLPAGAATQATLASVLTAIQALATSSTYALVAPSDSVALTAATRGITIGGSGNLSVKRPDGVTVGPFPVVAGQTIAIAATFIMATGTTATGILAQF